MRINKAHLSKDPLAIKQGIFYLQYFLLALFILPHNPLAAQARMDIPDAKINFGSVQRGEVLSHAFRINNSGNQPLVITRSEVACSCTSVEIPAKPILPKQSAEVKVSFDTKTVYGRQDREVQLFSNDPNSPHKLRFKANVSRK